MQHSQKQESNAENTEMNAGSEEIGALYKASISGETQPEQRLQETSRTTQEQLTNSNDEFVSCVSDTLTGNSREEETANAPLRVASPLSIQSVSEKEKDLLVAMDCTTLTLVDGTQGQSTSLLAENQDCDVEPRDCHEGGYSAAPVAQNEFSDKEAIANQTQGQVEQSNPTSLLVENSVSGGEVKTVDEGESSAASVPSAEKWSHEAIVAFVKYATCKKGKTESSGEFRAESGV
ncbi:MAG: hypothetical protein V7L05_25280 [Nostoc sp.]|uniref:hypothetical protein n=1 Tax=Nostoc sp. TaxID=1180 RepID=UPI002FF5EA79